MDENSKMMRLQQYIAGEILKDYDRGVEPQEPLISSGLIDSFNLVDLALFIEDEYGVAIDDAELNADTFDNLTELVELITLKGES